MVHLCIAHMGRVLSVKDCINLLAYPVCSCFLPVSSKISFKPLYELIFCEAYFIFCKTLNSSCCIFDVFKSSLEGYSFTKRWSFENNDAKKLEKAAAVLKQISN